MKLLFLPLAIFLVACTETLEVTPEDIAGVTGLCKNNEGVAYYSVETTMSTYRIDADNANGFYKVDQIVSIRCKNGAMFRTPNSKVSK